MIYQDISGRSVSIWSPYYGPSNQVTKNMSMKYLIYRKVQILHILSRDADLVDVPLLQSSRRIPRIQKRLAEKIL